MSNPPIRTDRDLSEDIRNQLSEVLSRNRPYSRITNTFFMFLLQAISFSVKIFVRRKIGRLTYSFFTIIVAYFWVRYFMGGDVDFLRNLASEPAIADNGLNSEANGLRDLWGQENYEKFSEAASNFDPNGYLEYLGNLIIMFLVQLGVLLRHGLQWRPPDIEFLIVYVFSYIVVVKGVVTLWKSRLEYIQRENIDPLSRGESIAFSTLEGKRIGPIKITRKFTLMWMDPLLVFLIGLLLWLVLANGNFGICIMLSGIILFWEERAVQNREQKAVLAKLATDRWTERVLIEYKEFKEGQKYGQKGSFGKVAFAEDEQREATNDTNGGEGNKTSKGTAGFA